MNVKDNIGIFIICIFLFINGVYIAKYLAIVSVYWHLEIPDPQFEVVMQQLYALPRGISFYDPIIINITTFLSFLTISTVFAVIIYLIFLDHTLKHSRELEWNFNQIGSGGVHAPLGQTGQEIIRKMFSKPLKNPNFIKHFSYFNYMFPLCATFVFSLLVTYLLVSDSMFGTNTFMIFVLKYQYVFAVIDVIFWIIILGIFEEVQKIHKYKITDFISKKTYMHILRYTLVYLSITVSCSIVIFTRNVYYILDKYENILVPEHIQVVYFVILLFTSGYIILIVSKKLEEILTKAIDE